MEGTGGILLELTFTARDLAHTRFALSPLWEVIASVRVLRNPAEHPLYRPWADEVRPRLAATGLDRRLLTDLVPSPPRRIPVFVAPPPATPIPDLGLELAALRATSPDRVIAGLDGPYAPRSPRLDALRDDPVAGLEDLVRTIEAYWDVALAPYWPRMRTLLEGDVLHRARILAEGGVRRLLDDLDPSVTWDEETLYVGHRHFSGARSLRGRGLLLVPSVFVWPRVFSITSPDWQPTLRYPPRGIATLWERRDARTPGRLAAVVGRSKARLLAELDGPASTTHLAHRTGMTAGAVSQHLTALRSAGLVSSYRTGRYVLYTRTSAGETLLTAARPPE
ncbi:DUF5937 family protein [Actinoallomurus acanthiterrae]